MDKSQKNGYGVTTDELMDFLKDNMLTKEDAKNFLTREDAKVFATKEDLKAFATKEDLGKFRLDTMDYLDEKFADFKGDLVILMRKEDKN